VVQSEFALKLVVEYRIKKMAKPSFAKVISTVKAMNILQITKYFYPAVSFGGPVQCTYNLSKYLVKRGHRVVVYTTDALDISSNAKIKEKYQLIDGIEVFYFRSIARLFAGIFITPDMIQALRKNISLFDVVHLHEYRTFQNIVFYCLNKNRVPYVLSSHGEYSYQDESWDWSLLRRVFESSFGNKLIKGASTIHALSQFEATQYTNAGIKRNKIAVVPNGVAPEAFSDVSQASDFRKFFGINEAEVVLYLGRIHKDKGIDALVKAYAYLSRTRDSVKLVIAGPDDGFLGTVKELVKELNVTTKVTFTGSLNRKQVLAAYNCATVVVYASIQEGFGIVPLEAGLMGKPVIVSDAPAMDFVKKGKFGLVVKYGNVLELTKALERILNNPELSREMGKNGKKFAIENYSWETIGKRFETMYYSILS
jgi:glycosyltransferase involved in cell wall biosynthesis